jgi:hypothetical protein
MRTVALTIGLAGLLFWLLSLARLRKRRLLSAGSHGITGSLLLAIAAAVGAVALNLHTYQRLTYEQPVAELAFERLAPHRFRATLDYPYYPSGARRVLLMNGDDWQLDARILKWKGLATLLGLNMEYRLERLSGRFRDLQRAHTGPYSVYALNKDARAAVRRWR